MAIRLRMRRDGDRLVPVSKFDADLLTCNLKPNRIYSVTVKEDRSLPQHRLYWAVLQFVTDNLPEPPEHLNIRRWPFEHRPDRLHLEAKIACGVAERVQLMDGSSAFVAGSTSFSRMDQMEFARFFDCAMQWLSQTFFRGRDVMDMMATAGYANNREFVLPIRGVRVRLYHHRGAWHVSSMQADDGIRQRMLDVMLDAIRMLGWPSVREAIAAVDRAIERADNAKAWRSDGAVFDQP